MKILSIPLLFMGLSASAVSNELPNQRLTVTTVGTKQSAAFDHLFSQRNPGSDHQQCLGQGYVCRNAGDCCSLSCNSFNLCN